MLQHVYGIFNFTFELQLSTRPKKYLGQIEMWDRAEKALATVLDKFGQEWTINPEDGAFYGPKIDIKLMDALKRKHQCATVQLDFQLPQRFELQYKAQDGSMQRPVMIHRAILGSVERMFAVLLEHTAGKWPFWLSPRQVSVVPVSEKDGLPEYAQEVSNLIRDAGYYVESDTSTNTMKKKIRDAQLEQVNFILVVGPKERDTRSVNLRDRDDPTKENFMSLDDCLKYFRHLKEEHVLPVVKEQPQELAKEKKTKEGKQSKGGKQPKEGKKGKNS